MTSFLIGVLFSVLCVAINNAAKTAMTKIYYNDNEIMKKIDIPGYPIYLYIRDRKNKKIN